MVKKKLYSFKIEPETINLLREEANARKISASQFLRESLRERLKKKK